ncbi:F0F1 ATP synthase subunit B' [Malaciobacter marinus]|uniref:F-type H+-transporting ATPase subunit b n=1 Tax=Malaciobacter marinus TaxID=505249 RepID=A0AB36ZVC6_9BACT|nr:F0F1 ATP synthase subunit B' [Malaciobacter marinus]PPK60847.1 F-type H+-transporting ATPase subunit b [Malaciobacter marinus]
MLDISPVLLLSSGIIFLLVVARLNSCLFKPLLKHMDDRADSIKRDLENAKSNSANVDGMLAEANDVIAAAKKEAATIREKAYNEAKESADAKLANAKVNLEEKSDEFAKSLQDDTKALKDSLIASMPQFNESLKAKLSSI